MGGRTDLAQAAEAIRSGMDIREVALEFPEPFIKYHKGMMAYKSLITSRGPRKCPPDGPEVWVFWGATGTGKSRRAFETWPDAYRKMTNDKWWDGYHGEETVIFDDFKGSSMRLHDFQLIVDRYPVKVETKGLYSRAIRNQTGLHQQQAPLGMVQRGRRSRGHRHAPNKRVLRRQRPPHSLRWGGPSSLGRPGVNVLEVELEVGGNTRTRPRASDSRTDLTAGQLASSLYFPFAALWGGGREGKTETQAPPESTRGVYS